MVFKKSLEIENTLIAGFLYNKMLEAEKAGIEVRYRLELKQKYSVLEAHLVEMTGILFGHAMEKLAEAEFPEKKIYFKLQQKEDVTIKFAYTSDMLSSDEVIGIWNSKGKKTDLYKLNQLVKSNNGKLLVKMKEIDDINYLLIRVKLPCEIQKGKHIFHL